MLGKGYMQEGSVRGSWDGEAPPLIIPVDWGGGDWLGQVIGAVGMVVGWDGRALAEGGVGRGLWSLVFGPVIPGLW